MLLCTNLLCWWNYVVIGTYSLTFGVHVQKGYGTCLVCVCICLCVSVCYHSSANIARFYTLNKVRRGFFLGFSRFLICGFSINLSVQKLWREKANMQISMYLSRPVLPCFEYRMHQ